MQNYEPPSSNDHDEAHDDTPELACRRAALAGGAALLAGAALATIATPAAAATAPDAQTLNALLSAEWSAIAAYGAGAAYLASPSSSDAMASIAPTVLAVAKHFASQHEDHAIALFAAVGDAGAAPIAQSSVSYAVPAGWNPSVLNVLKLAANAEKAASIAYTDALKQLSAASAAQLAASIGGVETQHFAILSLLVLGVAETTTAMFWSAADVCPRSFTASPASGVAGLETVPDFTYST